MALPPASGVKLKELASVTPVEWKRKSSERLWLRVAILKSSSQQAPIPLLNDHAGNALLLVFEKTLFFEEQL